MYNNSHKQYKTLNFKDNKFMTKGRKTTYDERIEVVAFCIKNNDNYQLTSDKYKVSYQQVSLGLENIKPMDKTLL